MAPGRDVPELLARGLAESQIASRLGVGSETLRARSRVAAILPDAPTGTRAAAIAIRRGLLASEMHRSVAEISAAMRMRARRRVPGTRWAGSRRCVGMVAVATTLAAALAAASGASPTASSPEIGGCPVFPPSSVWNQRVDRLPVAKDSATLIRSIGLDDPLHADFGAGLYDGQRIGIPYVVVSGASTPMSSPRFAYATESDAGPYPIPDDVPVEGDPHPDGGDRHALIVDSDTCTLYELYDLRRGGASWLAGSGATWNLRSNALRPAGWTSADAAGLPILPGLARYDEVAAGAIDHALRFTAPRTRRAFIYPARHFASGSTDPALPPMGLRVRLKASVDIRDFPPQARVVLEALKRYGMILADNGAPWYVSGAPDPRWSNDELHTLARVTGADFEVVDTSHLRP